jgi:LPS-assembly lipoprotein
VTVSRLRTLSALAATALLGACGFTPLYGATGLSPALASIEVEAPRTRTGHLLREELDDSLARDRSRPAAYRLALVVDEDRYARGLRVDDVATRYEVALTVGYILTDARTRRQLTTGTAQVAVSYDSADPPYAAVASHLDGQERAATQAAERIRLSLARWFATNGGPPAAR